MRRTRASSTPTAPVPSAAEMDGATRARAVRSELHDGCFGALLEMRERLEVETDLRSEAQAALDASVSHNEALVERSRLGEVRLQQLTRRLANTRDEERARMSRALRDAVEKALVDIGVGLATLTNEALSDSLELSESVRLAQALVERSIEPIRELANELQPLGIDARVQRLGARLSIRQVKGSGKSVRTGASLPV